LVDVEVDATGKVREAQVISSPELPFLPRWAEDAARQWTFEPNPLQSIRIFQLRFSFDGNVTTDSPRGVRSWYENPLTLHVEYVEPTVALLERVDGKIPERSCDLHDAPMQVVRVPIRYGLKLGYSEEEFERYRPFWKAQASEFPNAHHFQKRGCMVMSETLAEVYVCSKCLDSDYQWRANHPDTIPATDSIPQSE